MSPCKKGSRGARAAISEGGWGLRRGSPLGDSSSPSQGKGWELVNNPGTPGTGMLIIYLPMDRHYKVTDQVMFSQGGGK